MDKVKFSVSYNIFDDAIELLEYSIKAIRKNIDYVSVVYQTVSNFGEKSSPYFEKILNRLKEEGLIDELYHYRPWLFLEPNINETRKRNIGLKLSKKAGATYHMSMDSDEFYKSDDLEKIKQIVLSNNYDSSFACMQTFYKLPIYAIDPPEKYMVPLFYKIKNNLLYKINTKNMPCVVDPTRSMKPGKFILFDREEIEMYHMSYVRKDIHKKLYNSSAFKNYSDRVEKISQVHNLWKNGDKALLAGLNEVYFDTVEFPNYFNINLKEFE